jgi:hypothetical protein
MINPTRKLYLEVISTLDESVKKDAKILYDEKEVGFGDPTHIQDLKTTLQGLIRLRDILNPGSAFRNVCSQTIERLRKLVDKCENLAAKQPPLETVEKRVFENRFTPVVEHPYEKLLLEILENRPDPVDTMDFYRTVMQLKHKFPSDVFNWIVKGFNLLFIANVKEIDNKKLAIWLVPHEVQD